MWVCVTEHVSLLLQAFLAEFDRINAAVRKRLSDSVPRKEYIKLQEVSYGVLDLLMHNA